MTASDIIDALGGPSEVARICECSRQAVCQWRDKGIPKARLMFLKLVRPDLDWNGVQVQASNQVAA